VSDSYAQQLELQLNKTRDATPEEVAEWRVSDYWNRGDYDPLVMFVVIPTLVQLSCFALMAGVMYLASSL